MSNFLKNTTQRDFYSDVFDSVKSTSDTEKQVVEYKAQMAKIILQLKFPVLAMPQVFDSRNMWSLTEDAFFLELISKGIISTSIYGQYRQVKDFAIDRIGKPEFILSSLPFLNHKPEHMYNESQRIDKIRKSIQDALNNKRDLVAPILGTTSDEMEDIRRFIRNINLFDKALQKNADMPNQNYRKNLKNPKWLSNVLKENITTLKDMFPTTTAIELLSNIYDDIDVKKKNDRSEYYNKIDAKLMSNNESGIETLNDLKAIIDLSYNQAMATLIAKKKRIEYSSDNIYVKELIEPKDKEDKPYVERLFKEIRIVGGVANNTINSRILYEMADEMVAIFEEYKLSMNSLEEQDEYIHRILDDRFSLNGRVVNGLLQLPKFLFKDDKSNTTIETIEVETTSTEYKDANNVCSN